ncbi:hypothetical protein QJS10_CPA03g00549 [Acorus calamus]|uniref:Uncharacterized protein n=1 Tax=Acorus calamus TaxID=4465 RepID=A0AAV9F7A6_ACOCL|nr:hypothetical protein QJS10_CPA03g00549 [Acorus calamus]
MTGNIDPQRSIQLLGFKSHKNNLKKSLPNIVSQSTHQTILPKMYPHLFFFLFITFSFHPCSSQKNNQYKSCAPLPFSCGNFKENITFPFSIDGTSPGCGLPDLHLSCTSNNLTQLTMNNVSYQVKNIDYEKQIMTIADMAFINIDKYCSYLSNTSLDFSLFDYTDNDHNLTYYGCSSPPLNVSSSVFYELCNTRTNYVDYYYIIAVAVDVLDPLGDFCDSRYFVPIRKPHSMNDFSMDGLMKVLADGFDVMWNPGKGWCDKCVGSGGRCGFDESKPNDPFCLCPDGTYSDASCHAEKKASPTILHQPTAGAMN